MKSRKLCEQKDSPRVITCSICGTANSDLAVVCTSCKGYLQSKVENIDLFETLWGLIESPGRAFRKIVLARHKNYVILLSSLLGVSAAYAAAWYMNWGRHFSNILVLTGAGLAVGLPAGLAIVPIGSLIAHRLAKLLGGKATLRNIMAVAAYAGAPIVLSLVFVYPVEIAVFGLYFFDNNPPPLVINPFVYIALLAMHGAACLWSLFLLAQGTRVASGFGRLRSGAVVALVVAIAGATVYASRIL